jgi:hypothetical protein
MLHRNAGSERRDSNMATRRDFTAAAEILRGTPLPETLRRDLAEAFADYFADAGIPGYERDKFIHEATRGTREPDTTPTVNMPALMFTPKVLREDWEAQPDMSPAERRVLTDAPDSALWSSLAEAFKKNEDALQNEADGLLDDATDAVIRKVRKFYGGR